MKKRYFEESRVNANMPSGARRINVDKESGYGPFSLKADLFSAVEEQLKDDKAGMKRVMKPSHQ